MISCPRCGIQVSELQPVDSEMINKLTSFGKEAPPSEVCSGCVSDLKKSLAMSSGGVLMAQEKAKEEYRLQLWKGRVQLVKQGRMFMNRKMFSEAAIAYEKYLKVLELVFDLKNGTKLTPDMFKESARTSEITVLASTYWDLMRIYDTSPKYAERQVLVSQQLATFLQYTPIFPDILNRAQAFSKQAKNPQVFKQLIKMAAKERPRCFIATHVFANPYAIEVQTLRYFRDVYLKKISAGRVFIFCYYKVSPSIILFLNKHPRLNPFIRFFLLLIVKTLRACLTKII